MKKPTVITDRSELLRLMAKKPKYKNKKTTVDGITFDSAKEARRWLQLKALEQAGHIWDIQRQFRIELYVNEVHICDYVADFFYKQNPKNPDRVVEVVEDVKSDYTRKLPVYRLKKKLVKAIFGIDIVEV